MDSKTTINELKTIIKDFCQERDWDQFHNPKDLAIGLSTESNELLDLFRFKSDKQIHEIMNTSSKREKVEEELADSLFFILRFAQMNDMDLSEILKRKMDINNLKYPKETSRGNNKKYNE